MPGTNTQVIIDFIIRGMPNIQRAMRSSEEVAAASAKRTAKIADKAANDRVKAAENEAKRINAIRERSATMAGSFYAKQSRDEQRVANSIRRNLENAQRNLQRSLSVEQRAAERAARDRIRTEENTQRRIAAIRERSANMAGRHYAKQSDDERRDRERSAARWLRERERMARRGDFERRRGIGRVAEAAGQGLVNGMGRIKDVTFGTARMAANLGGGFDIASSMQRNVQDSAAMADMLNVAINPTSAIKANQVRHNRGQVEGAVDASVQLNGFSRGENIEALQKFVNTNSDLETAMKLLPKLGTLARATGGDLGTMTEAAANVGLSLEGMTDSGEKAKRIETVMRTLAGQAKAGNIHVPDMARQMGRVVASSTKFEGDNLDNIMKFGMIMEKARGGGGAWNASTSAQAITAFSDTFTKPARLKAFAAEGINVWADKDHTKIRDPIDLIAESVDKTKGSQDKLAKLFGSSRGDRAVHGLADLYLGGYTDPTTGKRVTGKDAIRGYANSMLKGAFMDEAHTNEAAGVRNSEMDVQFAKTQADFDRAVREKLMPAIIALAPEIKKLADAWVDINQQALPVFIDLIKTVANYAQANKDLIKDIASHPIGSILAFELTKSIGAAGIPALIRSLILGGGGGGLPTAVAPAAGGFLANFAKGAGSFLPTVGGGAGLFGGTGLLGSLGLGLAGGAAIGGTLAWSTLASAPGEEAAQNYSAKLAAFMRGDTERGMSPAHIKNQLDAARGRLAKNTVGDQFGPASLFSEEARDKYVQFKSDTALTENAELKEALRKATDAMLGLTTATQMATSSQKGGGTSEPAPNNTGYPTLPAPATRTISIGNR